MFCPQCGKETASGNSVCEHCGAPLWADTNAPQQPQATVEQAQQPVEQPQAPAAPAENPVPQQPVAPQQPYNAVPPQPPVAPPQPPVYPQQPYNAVPPQPPVAPPPAYPQQPQQPAPHISNYLAWAIVCIFLCCPLAIPAIVYASKVNNLIAMGDYEGAMIASKNAKTFCIIATVLGAIAIVLGIIGGIIGGMAASSYYYYY